MPPVASLSTKRHSLIFTEDRTRWQWSMKPSSVLVWAVVVAAATTSTPVQATPEAVNGAALANGKIHMDSNIIPSYESSTTALERWLDLPIGLWRVDRHWRALSISDALNVPSNFWKPLVKIRGIARVVEFYNKRALPCLHKQNMFGLYKKKEFIKVMNRVAECLYPGIKTNDDVDIGINDPIAISKEDMAQDVITPVPVVTPVVTEAPTPVVTEAPASVIASTLPASEPITEPVVVPLPTSPGLPVPTYFYNPASAQVAPFFALDINEDKHVTPDEWPEYIARVRQVALKAITKAQHPGAAKLLHMIINFHYNALTHCIDARLYALEEPSLDETTGSFDDFTKWVENNCNVKFRYSLLAGPPPFEWIAKNSPIITVADVKTWLTTRLATAKKDLASQKITIATSDQIRAASSFVKCAHDILGESLGAGVTRNAYYVLLAQINRCVASTTA